MLLEYLEDPDAQVATRVLLLYEFVPDEVVALRNAIDRSIGGSPEMSCALMLCPAFSGLTDPR